MVAKNEASVVRDTSIKVFKPCDKQEILKEVSADNLKVYGKLLGVFLNAALMAIRNLHIRLNVWHRIEIDIIEDHPDHQIVDVNFIVIDNKGYEHATHRLLGAKLKDRKLESYQSVSVKPMIV